MPPADVVYELTHVFGLEDFPSCLILALDDGVLINHSRNPTLVTNNAAPASTSFDVNSRRYLHSVAAFAALVVVSLIWPERLAS